MKEKAVFLFEKITAIYISLLCTVFLLWPGTQGYQGIADAKYTAFLILCGGYIVLMVVLLSEEILVGEINVSFIKRSLKNMTWVQRLVALYMCLTWVAAILSPYWPRTVTGISRMEGALTISLYCLCFLFVSTFAKVGEWILYFSTIGVILFNVVCFIQLLGLNPFGLYPQGMNYYDGGRSYTGVFIGTIGNIDFAVTFLCIVTAAYWVGVIRLKGKKRILCLAVVLCSLGVLFAIQVQSAFVAIGLGIPISLAVVLPSPPKMRIRVLAGVLAALILLIVLLATIDVRSGVLHEMHELLNGRVQDSLGSGRVYIWRNVIKAVFERPWFGYGPDTMIYAGFVPFSRYDPDLGVMLQTQIDAAHNEYLNIFFHQGVFAVLAYLSAVVMGLIGWAKNSRRDAVTAIAGCAVFCYCIQAFFNISTCITSPFFWIVFALLENRNILYGGEVRVCGKN